MKLKKLLKRREIGSCSHHNKFLAFIGLVLININWPLRASENPLDFTYVTVLPVLSDSKILSTPSGQAMIQYLDNSLEEVLKASERFFIVSPALIQPHIADEAKLQEVLIRYKIDALFKLGLSDRGDHIFFDLTMIGADLKSIYLRESTELPAPVSQDQMNQRLRAITYKLINRLPYDGKVLSVDGSYISLSAGKEQGLTEGSTIELESAKIEKKSPADGSWLSISRQSLGKAVITSLNPDNAVAEITEQNFENAITPGSGFRIENLPARRFFKAPSPTSNKEASTPYFIAKPLARDTTQESATATVHSPDQKATEPNASRTPGDSMPANDWQESRAQRPSLFKSVTPDFFDLAKSKEAFIGFTRHGITGRASMTSQIPPWLIQQLGLRLFSTRGPNTDILTEAELYFSETRRGMVSGMMIGSSIISRWIGENGNFTGLSYGAGFQLKTLSVNRETFGGYDLLLLKLHGSYYLPLATENFGFQTELDYYVFGLGKLGYQGGRHGVKDVSGLNLRLLMRPHKKSANSINFLQRLSYQAEYIRHKYKSLGEIYDTQMRLAIIYPF